LIFETRRTRSSRIPPGQPRMGGSRDEKDCCEVHTGLYAALYRLHAMQVVVQIYLITENKMRLAICGQVDWVERREALKWIRCLDSIR
jgi:hypothetical protein